MTAETNTNTQRRALTSASNLHRRAVCPGSAAAEAAFPPDPDGEESEWSAEGTLLHRHAEDPSLDRSGLTDEQRSTLTRVAHSEEAIFKSLLNYQPDLANAAFEEGSETELWVTRPMGKLQKKIFPGHCDYWRFYKSGKVLLIIDRKFGRNEVAEADANLQLRAYAVAGARQFGAETVYVAIVQPRLPREQGLSIGEYNVTDLEAARGHLLSIYDSAHNKDGSPNEQAPRCADLEACNYCSAKLHCDSYRAQFAFLADSGPSYLAKIAEISDIELAKVIDAVKFAAKPEFQSAVKAEAAKRIEAGRLEGYYLQPGANIKTVTNIAEAVRLLEAAGWTRARIQSAMSLAIPKLVEASKAHGDGNEKECRVKIEEILDPVLAVTARAASIKKKASK